ncbi:MAG: cytidine deaminase [Candidatus Nanopelagicales bacterium]|nr:cytidine deaminase [Candidatus Nanopelagicales bacterium]
MADRLSEARPDAPAGYGNDPDWAKLIVLARSARARVGAREGAAVRDETGRTHTAVCVELESLVLSALQLAVANAIATGARGIEAAVVVGQAESDPTDEAVVREVATDAAELLLCAPDGAPVKSLALTAGDS